MRIDRLVRMGSGTRARSARRRRSRKGLKRVAELGPDGLLYGDVPATRS